MNSLLLKEYAKKVFEENKGERICSFEYQNELYWMKQPEKLFGIWRILKHHPKRAFLNEIKRLQFLYQYNAPVPFLEIVTDDYFVMKNFGVSAGGCLENGNFTINFCEKILFSCAKALSELHRLNLIHGRPAIRDMLWKEGKITFIDFETYKESKNISYQKARDSLIFIHSLCREMSLNDEQIQKIIQIYKMNCDPVVWKDTINLLTRFCWVYYLLLPLKTFAKKDLIAVYRLFENMKTIEN